MEERYVAASRLVRREGGHPDQRCHNTDERAQVILILNAELHLSHLLKNGAARGWLGGSNYSTTFASFIRQQDESALYCKSSKNIDRWNVPSLVVKKMEIQLTILGISRPIDIACNRRSKAPKSKIWRN